MYEVDFLPVGEAGRHGDAITLRLTRPDTGSLAVVVLDAGFQQNGQEVVDHIGRWYETDTVDIAILSHPVADHIGGMGDVIRELNVGVLCIHRIGDRGGDSLDAAQAVDELIELAESRGTQIHEPFAGDSGLGGALVFLGPDEDYYNELVQEQVAEAGARAITKGRVAAVARRLADRFATALPVEVPFDDNGGTNPRNNSSVITLVNVSGHRMLFTADAGVPALHRAWDWLEGSDLDASPPNFLDLPHHGSRRNASSELLDRILGPTGQEPTRTAFVSVAPEAVKHPSPRVANAFLRRGYRVHETRASTKHHYGAGAPDRGWGKSVPLGQLDESTEDD